MLELLRDFSEYPDVFRRHRDLNAAATNADTTAALEFDQVRLFGTIHDG